MIVNEALSIVLGVIVIIFNPWLARQALTFLARGLERPGLSRQVLLARLLIYLGAGWVIGVPIYLLITHRSH